MFREIWNMIMYSEGSIVPVCRQNNDAAGDKKERAVFGEPFVPTIITPESVPKMIDDEDPEIVLLARKYGPLKNGLKIELTLQEALELFPRKRRKCDSFRSLIKRVKKEFDTDLIISSKKGTKKYSQ
jgi:hypothetical protein